MSNINNHGLNIHNKTLAQLSLSVMKEVNDEEAAACSGGANTKYSNMKKKNDIPAPTPYGSADVILDLTAYKTIDTLDLKL